MGAWRLRSESDTHAPFGKERGRKILDALRVATDPLALDVLPIDDRVCIELNVAAGADVDVRDLATLEVTTLLFNTIDDNDVAMLDVVYGSEFTLGNSSERAKLSHGRQTRSST